MKDIGWQNNIMAQSWRENEAFMATLDEQILRVAKEIVVKFIETGRVSPVTFAENFENIYGSVDSTVKKRMIVESTEKTPEAPPKKKTSKG